MFVLLLPIFIFFCCFYACERAIAPKIVLLDFPVRFCTFFSFTVYANWDCARARASNSRYIHKHTTKHRNRKACHFSSILNSKKKRKKIIKSEEPKYQPRLKVQLSHFHFSRWYVMRSFLKHSVSQSIQKPCFIHYRFEIPNGMHHRRHMYKKAIHTLQLPIGNKNTQKHENNEENMMMKKKTTKKKTVCSKQMQFE